MQAPAQSPRAVEKVSAVADGPGVVVEPGAKILHRSPVFYPSGVTTAGTVVVESTVNAKGEVTDAHVLSGPDELRNAALIERPQLALFARRRPSADGAELDPVREGSAAAPACGG